MQGESNKDSIKFLTLKYCQSVDTEFTKQHYIENEADVEDILLQAFLKISLHK